MFVDPITQYGYIIQKVRPRNTIKTPVIFKVLEIYIVHFQTDGYLLKYFYKTINHICIFIYLKFEVPSFLSFGKKVTSELKRVGSIPLASGIDDSFRNIHLANLAKIWPTFITGGDISRDGKTIILRSHNGRCILLHFIEVFSKYYNEYKMQCNICH